MANDVYCRFKVKVQVNGTTHFDGYSTMNAFHHMMDTLFQSLAAPTMNFGVMDRYLENAHMHYDMMIGQTHVAFEVLAIADPYGVRKGDEPLENKPSIR
ncbi:hypothetical protein LAV_00036 [Sphingobium phage Lacusarx]|uniref:Uncharacterized protein n=1 Tax=Sphingobium phage Lacusarx TaxID=1980139 RepID=A0A1W6DX44_9CAUD|nr:hypothetical protein FDH44_gp036 [Sphingobium phage Lacusarx]ARK07436.1 hypothetical protein LAV_00036 [Sphingobium phage Lacusarx]